MGGGCSLLQTPSGNRGCSCREMPEASAPNRISSRAFVSCDNCLAGDSFIGVASKSRRETGPLDGHGKPCPTEMEMTADLELYAEIAILDALSSIHPRAEPAWLRVVGGEEHNFAHVDRLVVHESVAVLDFISATQSGSEFLIRHPDCVQGIRSIRRGCTHQACAVVEWRVASQ